MPVHIDSFYVRVQLCACQTSGWGFVKKGVPKVDQESC